MKIKVFAQLLTVWGEFVQVDRVWLPKLLKLGGSFTASTVMVKVWIRGCVVTTAVILDYHIKVEMPLASAVGV